MDYSVRMLRRVEGGGGVFCTHAATDLRIVFQSVNVVKP